VLPKLVSKIIATESKAVPEEEDLKDLDAATTSHDKGSDEEQKTGTEEKEKEKEEQEQQDGPEERGSEWKWLATLLEETYSSIVGVSDKILNSSNFIKGDVSINITPLSTPSAASASTPTPATPLAGMLPTPYASLTPASGPSAPSSPSLRPTGSHHYKYISWNTRTRTTCGDYSQTLSVGRDAWLEAARGRRAGGAGGCGLGSFEAAGGGSSRPGDTPLPHFSIMADKTKLFIP
jgi:hypothetical protein